MMYKTYDLGAKARYAEAARTAHLLRRFGPTGKHGPRQTARDRRAARRREIRRFDAWARRLEARCRKLREGRPARG